jgi:hypothetical protein
VNVVQIVRFTSGLSDAEVRRTIEERSGEYRAIPGLLQKYYVHDPATREYGGIYVWEDARALHDFRETGLARTIPRAYQIEGLPRVEVMDVVATLRDPYASLSLHEALAAAGRHFSADLELPTDVG